VHRIQMVLGIRALRKSERAMRAWHGIGVDR
jgi:hypothetical protein